ncbi:TonB-dependent receptor [Akkermansiaceae bacterium]|nr:TonB-dependent receptor [Akkermansiaceae bacterium]MDB4792388.1 TonB-dependent receptor [bacterium]
MKQVSFYLSALLFGSVAMAQEVLEPLVVTGERESEGKTPELVKISQPEQVSQLQGALPGFGAISSDSAGYGDILSIRGTSNTTFFGPAGLAMIVDDVPFGDVYGYPTEFFDLEQMTLHRGPQGSRFGRNGAGGVLEMRTAGPTDEPSYKLSAEYGSYDSQNYRLSASGPINDKWSYTLQSYFKRRNSFNDNTFDSGNVDKREQFGALGTLYYRPGADFELRFRAMVETNRDGAQRLTALPGVSSQFGPGIDFLRSQDIFTNNSDFEGRTDLDRLQLSLHTNQDLGWANFKSISSFQKWELDPSTADLDLTFQPVTTSTIAQEQKMFTQEFCLESDQDADVRWSGGVFYLNKDSGGSAGRFFVTSEFGTFETQTTNFSLDEESVSLFGNMEWDANDALTLSAGGRLQYTETELGRNKSIFGVRNPISPPGVLVGPPANSAESEGWYFSPTLGATYQLNDETSLFARTSIGVKPEGYTAFSDNPNTSSFDEETSWESEVGLRYESADSSVGAELRGYFKRIDDYQFNASVPLTTDFIIVNAERVTALGLELEANWRPVDNLTLSASAGISEIEFDDYTDLGGVNRDGSQVPFLPEFTAAVGFRYDVTEKIYLQSSVRSIGTTYYDAANSANFKQGSYQIWDAEIGYTGDGWNAAVFGRNMLDEEYYTFINDAIAAGSPGDPGMVGVRVGLEF